MSLTQEQRKKLTDSGYSDVQVRAYEAMKSQPKPKAGGPLNDIKTAFKGGLDYAKQGWEEGKNATNLVTKTEAGLKQVGGLAGAAFSPLAPATKYIGKGIDYVADKISDNEGVQKFAETKAGQTTARVAEDVQNVSTGLSMFAGGSKVAPKTSIPKVTPKPTIAVADAPKSTGKIDYLKSTVRDIIPTKQGIINESVTKGLDLSPGDLATIGKSTGNDVGTWVSKYNLIGKNKNETQANINKFYKDNYATVRAEIDAVPNVYKQYSVPRYVDALKQIQKQIKGIPGLEQASVEVQNLLAKQELKLSDVQKAKELLDDHFSLYKKTGDVGDSVSKEGLANIRSELKNFIEGEVKKNNPEIDIQTLNNNVQTARSLEDAIITRAPKGLTKSNIRVGDLGILGIGWGIGGPLVGAALLLGKKVIETPTIRLRMARMIDKMSDLQKAKIQSELEAGFIPEEFAPFVKQKELIGRAIPPAIQSSSSQRESNQ